MRRWVLLLLLAALSLGCDDLGAYATGEGEVYRGRVVGVEDPPVLRRGFAAETTLEMTFDPALVTSLREPPGRITTSDGSLTDVALEPIVPLTHDVLSEYEIPVGGRVRNYIFVARPTEGPLAGREPMVFVSLMTDGTVEVRIIAGPGDPDRDYYGYFSLTRVAAG